MPNTIPEKPPHTSNPPPPVFTSQPALHVTNICNFIPITLDQESAQYATWVEFFTIHACAYNVLDHIDSTVPQPSDVNDATWKRLDASVKQWIYGTIHEDLIYTIMKPGATALELWKRLEDLFQDNKHTGVIYLEQQFSNLRLENFSNMTEYYI
ncbi:uncharacterized protein LOC104898248 [Beta vulgaris subsp. vulgaris]|uniref:uncharacterized protein LOC104898248 n=1 Tax=Beta vulgaris subsp. vulgaris TaxID=3555 RepID=UPI00053FC160|nr:uncharacterized protein LOC104898248 [Beta vulgaris subsp. vulgaris]